MTAKERVRVLLKGKLPDRVPTFDLLNPIERIAGMEPKEIHRRYPELILAGGIDVSQLRGCNVDQPRNLAKSVTVE
ncbi:MAG: hypothetical protein V2A65_06605 [Candidatus Omnitrophota bacterium]